ncbi:hypothetical protein SCB29_37120, partial [Paraburkholderia sp. SIMBA_055]
PPLSLLSEVHVPFVTIGKSCAIRSGPLLSLIRRNPASARFLAFGALLAFAMGKSRPVPGYKLKP